MKPKLNSPPDDSELIRRISTGEEAALGLLMTRYSPQVFSTAFRILRQRPETEEVTQDVFWALWRSPQRFDAARGPLSTWLVILARSRALDRLRRIQANAPRENELTAELLSRSPSLIQSYSLEREVLIEQLVRRLPAEQCWTVKRAYFEGYALGEIAVLEGTPVGTVKGRARFALKKLRGALGLAENTGGEAAAGAQSCGQARTFKHKRKSSLKHCIHVV